jgi:hypothetical protein
VLQAISSRSRCDRRLEEAGSDLRGHRRAGTGAYFLKMTRARIAALAAEQIEHAPCLREDGATCSAFAHVGGFGFVARLASYTASEAERSEPGVRAG